MATELDELHCIEGQIEEAIAIDQSQPVRLGDGGRYEAIHLQSVLREALVHCQLLRRKLEESNGSKGSAVQGSYCTPDVIR